MLGFEPDDEQMMLVEAIGRFADGPMRKVFRDAEEDGDIPPEVIQAGWDFGVLHTGIPESYGGFGEYSCVTGALAMEVFSYGDLAMTLSIGAPGLVAIPLMLCGTKEQKEQHLPLFCEATPPKMTAAIIEPSVQFDSRNLVTIADRDGDYYILNGSKRVVPLAQDADLMLIYANEDGNTQAYLIPSDTDGMTVGSREKLMGLGALAAYPLELNDCRIPIANKLGGDVGIDFELIQNHSRVAMASAAVGVAKAGYDYAREYARNRVQFGEPIAHRQAIAFMLAEMAIDVDAARLLVWETAWLLDQGKDVTREATVMKHFVDDMVMRVTDQTVQTLGGYGYIREFPAELWLRNARGFSSLDGLAIL